MALFTYTNSQRTNALVIPSFTGPDVSILTQSYWSNGAFLLPDGTTAHAVLGNISTGGVDWVTSIPYTRQNLMDTSSSTFYFPSGFNIRLMYSGSSLTWDMDYYGQVESPDGTVKKTGWTDSVTGTGSGNPPGTATTVHGTIFVRCTCHVQNIGEVKGYLCVFGYERLGNDGVAYFIPGKTIFMDDACFSGAETDPSGGIPISPEGGDGGYTLHAETLSFGTAEGRSDDMGGGGLAAGTAHGTHLYDMDLSAFSDFLGTAYAGTGSLSFSDLWQAYKNSMHDPLSGILGALILPINPPDTAVTYIRLSGQSIAVSGTCGYVTKRFGETSDASVSVVPYYNTFLDYEPFTKITLYLPFVGSVGINTNECMGGSISVRYWVDYCTGNCVAYVTLTDRAGRPSYYQYNGNCAAYVPVSGNDGGIASIISGASSVITGTVQAMSGNPAGIGSMIGGGMQIAEPKTTQKHVGGFSGGAGCVGCLYPFIVVNHPAAATAQGYTGIMGAPSAMTGTVGQYHGFTAFMHADTHGIPCTAEEMQEIEGALSEGVYL